MYHARMDPEAVRQAMYRERVAVILREDDAGVCRAKARALHDGGIRIIEVTYTTPDAAAIIDEIARMDGATAGGGTIMTVDQAREAVSAGARFLVSPVNVPPVAGWARANGVVYIAGALTPQEIWQAWEDGIRPVKVFPVADVGGADYLRHVLAPMPFLELFPTGLHVDDYGACLDAGARVAGIVHGLPDDPAALRAAAARIARSAGDAAAAG
jgi:2-dehydro-3-deoxyphosphogluconate aldolase / (4S)-4-hydroxy-2-oxoglutarate aldolase